MAKPFLAVAVLSALLLAMTASSGCIFCDTHQRQLEWRQPGLTQSTVRSVDHMMGDFWGGVTALNDTFILLDVFAKQPISHEEAQVFAVSLFENQTWPAPTFEDRRNEWGGCHTEL